MTHDVAFALLPVVGSAPFQSKSILRLEAQRNDLTLLLSMSVQLQRRGMRLHLCPRWSHQLQHCIIQHKLVWVTDVRYQLDPASWLEETRSHIRTTRTAIRRAKQQLERGQKQPIDASPAAAVHRMLESDAFP